MEEAIRGDFAFVKAWKGDTAGTAPAPITAAVACVCACVSPRGHVLDDNLSGNLVFKRTSRNFNPMVATAGKITIAEVEQIVPAGQPVHHWHSTVHRHLRHHNTVCPGSLDPDEIHVPGIYVSRLYQPPSFDKRIERLTLQKEPGAGDGKGLGVRERIVKRAAKELKDGM